MTLFSKLWLVIWICMNLICWNSHLGSISYWRRSTFIFDSCWISFYTTIRATDRVCHLIHLEFSLLLVLKIMIIVREGTSNGIITFLYFVLQGRVWREHWGRFLRPIIFWVPSVLLFISWLLSSCPLVAETFDKGALFHGKVQRRANCDPFTGICMVNLHWYSLNGLYEGFKQAAANSRCTLLKTLENLIILEYGFWWKSPLFTAQYSYICGFWSLQNQESRDPYKIDILFPLYQDSKILAFILFYID